MRYCQVWISEKLKHNTSLNLGLLHMHRHLFFPVSDPIFSPLVRGPAGLACTAAAWSPDQCRKPANKSHEVMSDFVGSCDVPAVSQWRTTYYKLLNSSDCKGPRVTHLLMHMAGVLLYELSKAYVIWTEFWEPVKDTGLTGVKKRQVLGNLWRTKC